MKKVSIVIPVFNSTNSLTEISDRVSVVFSNLPNYSYEIIFIDDCSPNPQTWSTLRIIAQNNKNVLCIRLMRNFGQQAATICGFKEATGDYIVTMDDDLQHLPEEIPILLSKKEHDIVIGQFLHKKHSLFKRLTSKLKGHFDHIILGKPRDIQLSPFRLISKDILNAMKPLMHNPYPFIPAMMFYVTKDVVGVNVHHNERMEGTSGYNLIKMIKLFSNLLISNSSLLLRFIGNIGMSISVLSFIIAIYFIFKKVILSIDITGWTSLFVTILFIGGLLLFSLGIIGEYLIRIIQGIDGKPTYIIRDKLKNQNK